MRWFGFSLLVLVLLGSFSSVQAQAVNINTIGGFESSLPSYWTIGNAPGGATLTWATDQYKSSGHSLKISKPAATADSAAWISENMCDIWSPTHSKNVDIFLGAYVKTEGVNIAPTTDDEKWWISYSFWDTSGVFIGETKLPIDQSVATSSGWIADTNGVGETILGSDSWKTIVKFVAGKNATGTVWADDFVFYGRAGAWAGQDWNTNLLAPTGWYYWLPPNGGNDGLLNDGFENTRVTSTVAHSGLNSLMFELPFDRVAHDGFVGTQRFPLNQIDPGIQEGSVLRLSVWIKANNLVPDSAALYPGTWSVGFTPLWFTGAGNNYGYGPVGPSIDYTFTFPAVTSFDWTKYTLDITVPSGVSAKDLEVRLHVYARFTGTIYFDDLTVEKLDVPDLNAVGSFESSLPSYWTKGNEPSGASLSWATDQYKSSGHSLKISKPAATADSAAWISENMCDIWSPTHSKNVDIFLGAYVKTEGVNIAPTTDDEKWWISYSFWDTSGVFIGETKLPIDQSITTSSGWLADTNGVGETILGSDSWKTIVKFVAGKNATGTVWADDFVFYGRAGAWAGQDWNANLLAPTGWYYWLPPNGGNDGLLNDGFENTRVTSTVAHSGLNSLMFELPFDRVAHDGFVGTRRFLFNQTGQGSIIQKSNQSSVVNDIQPGDVLRLTVWIKASNLVPDSAALYPGTWSVGFTPLWFAGNTNNFGYSPVGPSIDYTFTFPPVTSFEWTPYTLDVTVPDGVNAKALEVRLHVYARFTGTIYFDDLTVEKLDMPQLNAVGGFESSLPSYWTKGNEPSGASLSWATDQYKSSGHSLKISKPAATADSAAWISENMCDIWSPTHSKNVDIFLGANVKTEGVNIAPTTDDEKWWISYSFWDTSGVFIGETKLPIDQSVATSSGWIADTNGVGETILGSDSWKTIVKFVAGKNATGTVWADDFVFYGRAGAWAGQDWNTNLLAPTGWYYWLPPNGGNDGLLNDGFENTRVTSTVAHSGLNSLMFELPFDRVAHDGFVGTQRFMLDGSSPITFAAQKGNQNVSSIKAVPGDILRLTVWIKASNLVPDSAALYPGTWAVGFTPLWFTGTGHNYGYGPVGPSIDYTFTFPAVTSFDWTPYSLDVTVPEGVDAKALEVRLHVYSRFTGTIYFDDLSVEVIGTTLDVKDNTIPRTFDLANNYPNPFNPTTTIRFAVPQAGPISLMVYNVLGQQVRILAQGNISAGYHDVVWDGKDDRGMTVQSGVYFYRLQTGSVALVKKMVMIK
jgi:hypothetical protein